MMPLPWVRIGIGLAVVLGAFDAGWTINGWRMGRQYSQERLQQAQTAADTLRAAQSSRDELAARLRIADDTHQNELRLAQDETNRLRDRLAVGAGGLRIAAKCPAAIPTLPQAASAPIVDTPAGAELDSSARLAYFALRDGINRAQAQLAACQTELKERL